MGRDAFHECDAAVIGGGRIEFPHKLHRPGIAMTPQLDATGRLRHLLTLEGLPRDTLVALLDRAQAILDGGADARRDGLAGIAVCTLFFEPSTRTRLSFQRAAQRLGADVLNFDASTSSTTKGESALDTFRNIEAMGVRGFVVRHSADGAVAALADAALPGTALLNAGDGRSAHPTQGLLDMLTLRQARGADFSRMKILIVGDLKHSRVARSDLHALRTLGVGAGGAGEDGSIDIRVCGPRSLLPDDGTLDGCTVTQDFDAALDGVDAVMMLRLQRERMAEGLVSSLDDYHRDYGLTAARLHRAPADAVVMHPGPMNRGVEIDDDVADGAQSLILKQVGNGVAVRMAVLEALLA
jgi:aspartate carbamoyltransferase catalytic subunit